MKGLLTVAAVSLAVSEASAHYIFQQLTTGGVKHDVFQYIRKNSNYNSPVTDLSSHDLRCNVGATGAGTDTVTVKAGDSFTFTLDTPVYHQGPVSLYMSKAPGKASDYDGSGPWFKIKDWAPDFSSGSATWNMAGSYTYNIPTCIPNGDYLLRIQSLGIHNPWPAGIPQFYISCAQITVTGGGNGNPGPTALIPGAFKETDPGYTANASPFLISPVPSSSTFDPSLPLPLASHLRIYSNFHNYTVPGPAVFSCNGGGANPSPDPSPSQNPTPTTLVTSTTTRAAPTTSSSSAPPSSCTVAKWGQCGGQGYSGCTACAAGSTCSKQNDYFSQCL
ncbi:glycoside hydrolase family 61 protein [Chaetomium strumarium]|uniref:lytic cellulose monooxygenase (C4-dehydrogenating) n=1 Tax=Chaetomium strumarium TaxID=1170767 RepID=A0AAJ0H3I7_9PEZI|nr:glycoside hydrolase family 61 protein [Chaetomium strumarium]